MFLERAGSHSVASNGIRGRLFGCASPIVLITAAYMAIGLAAFAAWQVTGETKWVERFFRTPGAILLVWLAVVQLWLSVRVSSHYSPTEPMYRVWLLISASAVLDMVGATLIQVLGFHPAFRRLGHLLGGTLRFSFLAAGLFWALKVYRRAGFLGRHNWWQRLALAAAAVYVVLEAAGVVVAVRGGKDPSPWEMLGWPVDPLLWVLLAQAFLLRNSVKRMGDGWVGRCWKAISTGVFLILLGNVGGMAEAYGYLPWPWNSITWYVWIPAACAFALAPAYQLDAIHRATAGVARPPLRTEPPPATLPA